jgi:hypothetical protein
MAIALTYDSQGLFAFAWPDCVIRVGVTVSQTVQRWKLGF